jgi:hypothetical protein
MKHSNTTRDYAETEAEASSPQQQKLLRLSCDDIVGSSNSTDRKSSSTLLNDYIGALYGLTRCQQVDSLCRMTESKTNGRANSMKAEGEPYAASSSTLDRISDSIE